MPVAERARWATYTVELARWEHRGTGYYYDDSYSVRVITPIKESEPVAKKLPEPRKEAWPMVVGLVMFTLLLRGIIAVACDIGGLLGW